METLAKLFVGLVTVANTVAPQANIPRVLGVQIAQDTTVDVQNVDTTNLGSARSTRVREAVEDARIRRQEAIEEFQARRQAAKEEWETRREEFKQRLTEIRDERKREIVKLMDLRMEKMLERWVEHWNRVLARLTEILAKVGTRADKAEAAGHDVSSTRAAITEAEAAIAEAQAAVNELAGKTFVIEITDEENLGQNVSDTIHQVREELQAVREKVRAARQAVLDVLHALQAIRGVDEIEVETE